MPTPALPTDIMHVDPTLCVGVSRNLLVSTWSNAPESSHLRAMARVLQTAASKHREHLGVFNVILASTPRFTEGVRDDLARVMGDARLQGAGTAYVVLVGGLGGVATRAFLSTALLIGRPSAPNKVFSESRTAATWLGPHLSKGSVKWSVDEILAVEAHVTRAAAPAS